MVASTKSNADLFSSFGLWFANFNLIENIKTVLTFQDGVFVRWALNSVIYAVVSAVGASFLATAAGYAFAKYKFPGGTALFAIILGAIMVPLAALTVPTYLLFARAQLTDTYLAVILPSLVTPFGVFLMRVYAADAVDDFADSRPVGSTGSESSESSSPSGFGCYCPAQSPCCCSRWWRAGTTTSCR